MAEGCEQDSGTLHSALAREVHCDVGQSCTKARPMPRLPPVLGENHRLIAGGGCTASHDKKFVGSLAIALLV